jgi:hypothetical protein
MGLKLWDLVEDPIISKRYTLTISNPNRLHGNIKLRPYESYNQIMRIFDVQNPTHVTEYIKYELFEEIIATRGTDEEETTNFWMDPTWARFNANMSKTAGLIQMPRLNGGWGDCVLLWEPPNPPYTFEGKVSPCWVHVEGKRPLNEIIDRCLNMVLDDGRPYLRLRQFVERTEEREHARIWHYMKRALESTLRGSQWRVNVAEII